MSERLTREGAVPDERKDSIRQGISAPDESPSGKEAEEERRKRAAEGPEIGGAMGGTSDAESAGDESALNRALHDAEEPEEPTDEASLGRS
jgi:hypothetical protein